MRAPSPQRGEGRGGGGRGGGGGPRTYEKILGFRTPHPRSLRSHSRSFGSAFFTLRTASEGRLRSPRTRGEVCAIILAMQPHPSFGNERHEVFASKKNKGRQSAERRK